MPQPEPMRVWRPCIYLHEVKLEMLQRRLQATTAKLLAYAMRLRQLHASAA